MVFKRTTYVCASGLFPQNGRGWLPHKVSTFSLIFSFLQLLKVHFQELTCPGTQVYLLVQKLIALEKRGFKKEIESSECIMIFLICVFGCKIFLLL